LENVVRGLLAEHVKETQSRFAEALLRDWDLEKDKFFQVVPKEMLDKLEHPVTRAGDSQVTAVAGE